MIDSNSTHTFHIPVMGIGFTIDTPVKVAHYGISSVISLVDDMLIEKMREFYCTKLNIPFQAITEKVEDFRAKRITSYLNLIDRIVKEKFNEVKNSVLEKGSEIEKYMEMLPDYSSLKQKFYKLVKNNNIKELYHWVQNNLTVGSIDVNIMTKLDKENYIKNEKLPVEYNDAHAALRGFANSNLNSSVVLSAGMNPRLYSYFEKLEDFYPDENGKLKKKITLKVSDYRSALIQGKFLAKKGLWVSEYRIESGLNCGGHTFATDGYLMGPILEEFKNNRDTLIQTIHEIFIQSLKNKNRSYSEPCLKVKFTAQGGVGTAEEHKFLLDYYQIDSVGWGSPFLLVPEVTNVDSNTLNLLMQAKEEDLYLSNISPLGVPFNSLRGNTKDIEKLELIKKGRPGSSCPKKYASLNNDFTEKRICTASHQYQSLKIKELETKNLSQNEYETEFNKIVDKSCICVGLGTASLLVNNLDTRIEGKGVSVCPGPNIAYFSKIATLKEMINHIYGRTKIIKEETRPNMFVKELKLYIDFFKKMIDESPKPISENQIKHLVTFQNNLKEGIEYYKNLISDFKLKFEHIHANISNELDNIENELNNINLAIFGQTPVSKLLAGFAVVR